jgi:predicted  nucleic acid-binding Zn-ribbon protein
MTDLDALYEVQAFDTQLDQLRSRRATLAERDELDRCLRAGKAAHDALVALRARRDEMVRSVKALDDEIATIAAKAQSVDDKLYSGTVTSPRELQDLQADLEQLRRHQRGLEDRELELMEQAEALEAEVAGAEHDLGTLGAEVERLRRVIAETERSIDDTSSRVGAERDRATAPVPAALLADYERRRARNQGIGAALLVGDTCQGCRLSIPSTELDEIRRDAGERIFSCDNCGAILVPR